jgi:hypothetical protein
MQHIVRSAAGANLQTCQLLKKPLVLLENSTLNQKFNIQKDTIPADSDIFSMQYLTIGNMGHRMLLGSNNIPYPSPVQHLPEHSGLYNHIPFVLRLPNEDLTPQERIRYRLRRMEQHDGTTYVAYYGLVMDLTLTQPKLELRVVDGDNVTSTPFAYTLDNLNPTQPTIPPGQGLVTGSDYIASTAKVPFKLTADDVVELLNVANILYGDENYAIISEIGVCHGVDRVVTGDFNGQSASYTEVIGCQITTFVSSFFALPFMNTGVDVTFDVGSVEPLLTLGPI